MLWTSIMTASKLIFAWVRLGAIIYNVRSHSFARRCDEKLTSCIYYFFWFCCRSNMVRCYYYYFINLLFIAGLCIPSSRLYPFGPVSSDQAFTGADDQSTSLNLKNSFVFYGISHNTVFVSECILHMNVFIVYFQYIR